ncbi:MAG TPA: histidine kinase [Verrucomicrobiae bacterium]|nr:histidine kinase [Verrucomicrobiae bacterium]
MIIEKESRLRQWAVRAGLCFAICSVFALAEAVSSYLHLMKYEKPISWAQAVRQPFKSWYAFGVFSFGILWLCRRVRLEAGHFGRWFAKHFAASLVFALLFVTCIAWLIAGERSVHDGSILEFSDLFTKFAIGDTVWFVMMYWMVVLGHFGWSSYQNYRQHELAEAELHRQLVEARLDALRMQLNPHFLFNTLHTISALIHENPEAADRVVARLSELLRQSLDQSKAQEVPLHQELAFLDRYLEIEQMRFADRLDVQRNIEAGVQGALVPFLILQPLVENAIRHGIEQREEKGRLVIGIRRDNGRLELSVSDNGSGLPDENDAPREGIGLSNTRSRLRHLYSDNQKLELKGAPGGGLEARITIPYHTQAKAV